MSRLALILALALPAVAKADVVVKLATLAPEGSQWHTHLREIGEK